ncbi:MAG: threonylcarbamoyl-AMP synthase [Candidatus Sumerlaeia bacterium]|nr:threonylcarbamoyl-AMP synthase [Candidatus Sumerlaeia bacterium]
MPERLDPTPDGLRRAAELLAAGLLVAFPTETVYGLGADATNPDAIRRLYEAKGRPTHNPLIVHLAKAEDAPRWAAEWPESARRLAQRYWPGPLTLVVPVGAGIAPETLAGGSTVGLRVPDHPVALALLALLPFPLAAPSANASGTLSPVEAAHVLASLGDRVAAVLDGGRCRVGIESTVVDCTDAVPRVLRPGVLTAEEIGATAAGFTTGGALRSPGLLDRHYAPAVPLRLVSRPELERAPDGVARVFFGAPDCPVGEHDAVLPRDPRAAAAALYATLWNVQSRATAIWVEAPPTNDEWHAVRDRLSRAVVPS